MAQSKTTNILKDLETFQKELREYYQWRSVMKNRQLTNEQLEYVSNLRRTLVKKAGKYRGLVKEITDIEKVPIIISHKEHLTDIWTIGLLANPVMRTPTALSHCIDAVGQTIGKLEDDIKRGIRDKQGNLVEKPQRIDREPLKTAGNYGGMIVDKEFELTVQGTPDMLLEPIRNVIRNLNSQGYSYDFRRTSGRPDYTNWDKTYFASYGISQGTEGQIGTISFQLIRNDTTILKTSRPDEWNSFYSIFLNSLFTEFQRLGYFKEEKPAAMVELPPKAFISHGKESVALNKLEEFLRALGVEPLIVKEQPSLDKTVDDKVNYYLSQADFVVILGTGDDKIEGKLHPRQNVIHEIGLAQKTHSGKIIYLLEEGTEFPSNISPKVWEHFKQRNMVKAFLCIVRELRAYGILKAVKP